MQSRQDHLVSGKRYAGAACARPRQVDVKVIAFESNEVHLPAVRLDEWRQDLATDLRDIFLQVVHGIDKRSPRIAATFAACAKSYPLLT